MATLAQGTGSIASGGSADELTLAGRCAAYRWTMLALGFYLAAAGLGLGWDRAWHATHPFRDFFSPPHLFIYSMFALAMLSMARLCGAEHLRACFAGEPVHLPGLRVALPGPLAFAAGGLAVVGVAGLLDLTWHSLFGLDETGWSLPHALLGWGIMLSLLGLISCRLRLAAYRPLASHTPYIFAALLLMLLGDGPIAPFNGNHTAEGLRAVYHLPVLAADKAAQHTFRIYSEHGLTRSNPLFMLVSAFAGGAGLALALALFKRRRVVVVAATIAFLLVASSGMRAARFFGLPHSTAEWLPVPFLAALLIYLACRALRAADGWSWAAAGLGFGLIEAAVWTHRPAVALASAALLAAGALAGDWLAETVQRPDGPRLVRLFAVLAVAWPVTTGIIDLWLRTHTA